MEVRENTGKEDPEVEVEEEEAGENRGASFCHSSSWLGCYTLFGI